MYLEAGSPNPRETQGLGVFGGLEAGTLWKQVLVAVFGIPEEGFGCIINQYNNYYYFE